MTYPTGMVTSLHREIERSINIDIESSSRDDDVTVITNLSSVEASYTVVQGRASSSGREVIYFFIAQKIELFMCVRVCVCLGQGGG